MVKINRDLISGSLILLITFNLYNLINFIFQFAMARMLSPADYGMLATLFSFIYIFGIFSEPLTTVIAKYSAEERDNKKIKNLLKRSLTKAIRISLILFMFYCVIAILLTSLLDIPYLLLILVGFMIFASFFPPITRGIIQGRKMFKSLGINLLIEGITKLSLAIVLVLIGWRVYGAVLAAVIGSTIALVFSFSALRNILKSREEYKKISKFYAYSWSTFFIILSILIFFSLDIILARIVFDATTAGYYAIASTLAKTIFLATQPISKALFPMSAEVNPEKGHSILINALGIILLCIITILIIFYLFPNWLILIFAGREIIESITILFYLAIAISLLSITNLILLYKISLRKVRNYWIFLIFPIIEAALLYSFSSNLVEFSLALVVASAIFLWGVVYLHGNK